MPFDDIPFKVPARRRGQEAAPLVVRPPHPARSRRARGAIERRSGPPAYPLVRARRVDHARHRIRHRALRGTPVRTWGVEYIRPLGTPEPELDPLEELSLRIKPDRAEFLHMLFDRNPDRRRRWLGRYGMAGGGPNVAVTGTSLDRRA